MQAEEKKPYELSLVDCVREVNECHENQRKSFLGVSVIMLIMAVVIAFLGELSLIKISLFLVLLGLGASSLVLYFISRTRVKKLNELDFHIIKALCSGKSVKKDSEDSWNDEYFLEFGSYGKYKLDYKYISFPGIGKAIDEFERTQINDEYYLVFIGQDKKIGFAFNAKMFSLSEKDFDFDGSAYVPQKDISINERVARKAEQDLADFTDEERNTINEYYEKYPKLKRKLDRLLIVDLIALALTVAGYWSNILAFLNAVCMLIPGIVFIVLKFKYISAMKALTLSISEKYTYFYKYRAKYDSMAIKMVFLGVFGSILIYLANAIIFVTSIDGV